MLAEIPRPSLRAAASIVSSLEFNHDGSLFATAGVSKRISVFEYAGVVTASGAGRSVHCPVVELVTRSKLSCLSWNRYLHSHVAASDYDGEAGRRQPASWRCLRQSVAAGLRALHRLQLQPASLPSPGGSSSRPPCLAPVAGRRPLALHCTPCLQTAS